LTRFYFVADSLTGSIEQQLVPLSSTLGSAEEKTISSSNDVEDHIHSPTNKKRKIEIIAEPNLNQNNQNTADSSTSEQNTNENEQTQTESPQQKKRRLDVQ
jgi:hypothetical protein